MSYIILLAIVVTYGIYRLAKAGMMETRLSRFLGILMISTVATLMNVGPVGLFLGGPSILMSAVAVSFLLDRTPKAQ